MIIPASFSPTLSLLLATLLLAVAFVTPRVHLGWPLWLRAVWRVVVFAMLTIFVQHILGSPLRPRFGIINPGERLWEQLIEAGWWMIGARGAVGLMRMLVVLENKPQETQIVSDLVAGAIYVATMLAIVNFAFEVPIGGLLATSGVIAIVLGLALQNTLSDVFSGIAVGLERPYKAGDLLWVEGSIEGHVTHVTWRSTHIATGHNNIAVVPNSVIAKARLINRSLPTTVRGDSIVVKLDARATTEHCTDALIAATRACRIPIGAPGVACTGLQGDGTVFEISFSVASSSQLGAARTELYTKIHRHLRHAGIALAVEGIATLPPVIVPTPAKLLAESDLFGVIDPVQRDLLAQHFTAIRLPQGDELIEKGATPEALFIIAAGTVEITVDGLNGPRVVHRMSPGEALGAIGLITGTPFVVTATALTPIKAYRLDKGAIAAAIKASPDLSDALEALAQRGQEVLRHDAAAHEDIHMAHPEMFLSRLRGFLRLLAS
jgi:small-conductance mechanosensitive channel/CRP-like cAMP-binding protein